MRTTDDNWLVFPAPKPTARLRLFCFPYSGSGASAFQAWTARLPREVELCAVQLPGRETRLRETPLTSLRPLLEALMDVIPPYLDKPYVFFGHSLGALIAFELARKLRRDYQTVPLQLFVSARPAPQTPPRESPVYRLPDEQFIESLRQFNGTADAVLDNKELMNLLLPVLRADFQINETYFCTAEEPLECPITAFRGADDEMTSYANVDGWREQTSNSFILRTLPGGHFFIYSAEERFWQIFSHDLQQLLINLKQDATAQY